MALPRRWALVAGSSVAALATIGLLAIAYKTTTPGQPVRPVDTTATGDRGDGGEVLKVGALPVT